MSALASRVPSGILSQLPSNVALSLRSMSQPKPDQLPTHAAGQAPPKQRYASDRGS